jgi:hypothetical protein
MKENRNHHSDEEFGHISRCRIRYIHKKGVKIRLYGTFKGRNHIGSPIERYHWIHDSQDSGYIFNMKESRNHHLDYDFGHISRPGIQNIHKKGSKSTLWDFFQLYGTFLEWGCVSKPSMDLEPGPTGPVPSFYDNRE